MSFAKDLEAAEPRGYLDFQEFDKTAQVAENIQFNINNNQLASLRKLLALLEDSLKRHDVAEFSKISTRVSSLVSKLTASFKSLNESVTQLNQIIKNYSQGREDDDSIQYLSQKQGILINQMSNSLKLFQGYQKRCEQLEKRLQLQNSASGLLHTDIDSSETADPLESVQLQIQITYEPINAEELEEQTLLVQEREREIHQISQDISEINDIYLNLHQLVTEQQSTIDNIEENIIQFADDARGATVELRKAERYQRRSSGRMACCLFILLGVLGSIIFIGLVF